MRTVKEPSPPVKAPDGPTIDPRRPLRETLIDLSNWKLWFAMPAERRAALLSMRRPAA